MKRKVFLRIFGAVTLCLVFLFTASVFLFSFFGESTVRNRLDTETKLACSVCNQLDGQDFSIFNIYYNNDELRVTVISSETLDVLFESDTKSPLENHADREEVRLALVGTPKAIKRYSNTFSCYMTYYALQTELRNGTSVVVRLAVRSSEVSTYILSSLPFLLLALVVALAFALFLSGRISKSMMTKINDVGYSLKSLNAGQFQPLDTQGVETEFSTVFEEINTLNENTHEAMRRIEREGEKLKLVLDNVSQGIVALNHHAETVFVNDSALTLLQVSGEWIGQNVKSILFDEKLSERLDDYLLKREDFFCEYEYGEKYLAITGKKVKGKRDDRDIKWLLLFTDVTAEKEIARQKSEFFANASHELKTPVTVTLGFTELLLQDERLSDKERKQMERLHKESLRMASLIADMLKISKLERSAQEDEECVEEVSLREIVLEVLAELSGEMQSKSLHVATEGDGKVFADPKKLFELTQNLVSNAVHYNKENGWIRVSITQTHNETALVVEDGGIGIEKEHLPRLCERFYRVDKSRSKKTGGTGLGLSIVKHICALYDASLQLESTFGEGTKITVTFKK